MDSLCPIRFITSEKGISVYKVLVFTYESYTKFVQERGRNYVFDMFMEICRGKRCQFFGLRTEGSYIYALIGVNSAKNGKGQGFILSPERSCRAR